MAPSSLQLQINDTIRVGAQLVVVEILTANTSAKGLAQGQQVVAKLYDPMCIDGEFYINPFLAADKDYTYEAAAYTVHECRASSPKIPLKRFAKTS